MHEIAVNLAHTSQPQMRIRPLPARAIFTHRRQIVANPFGQIVRRIGAAADPAIRFMKPWCRAGSFHTVSVEASSESIRPEVFAVAAIVVVR